MKKYWPYFAFAVIALVFFYRFLDGLEVFAFKDLSRYFYPLRHLMVEQVKAGHLPLWNPFIFCGMPLYASLQICFLYPLTIIYYILPFSLAFNYYIVIHYFLASVFMYLLMRHFGYEKIVSFLSGMIFAYSGYLLSVSNMNTSMSSVIWLPLVVLFWDKHLTPPFGHPSPSKMERGMNPAKAGERGEVWNFVILLSVLTLMFLGGEPTIIFITAWLMFFYGLFFADNLKKMLISLVLVFIVVAGLAAVQLIPFVELVNNSDRVVLTQYKIISMRSLPPRELVNFVMPIFFGNQLRAGSYVPNVLGSFSQDWLLSTYIGFIPLFFASLGIFLFSKKSNFWLGVFVASLIMAIGSYTPIYHLAYKFIPGISSIRFPVKYLFMAFFALSILSGMGFNKILWIIDLENKEWLKRVSFVLGLIFIITGVVFIFLKLHEAEIFRYYSKLHNNLPPYLINQILANVRFNIESFGNLMLLVFLSAFSVYAVLKGYLKRKMFCFFILGMVFLDLFTVNAALNLPSDPSVYDKATLNIKILKEQKGVFRYYYSASFEGFNRMVYGDDFDKSIIEAKDRLVANRILPYKLADFYGYESILLDDFRKFTINYWPGMYSNNRSILDALNCKYLINGEPLKIPNIKLLRSAEYFYGRSYLYENLSAMPRAFFAHNVEFVPTREEIQKKMQKIGFNARRTVFVEGKPMEHKYNVAVGNALISNYAYDNIAIKTDNKNPGLLFVGDVFYPGWIARIDGKETKILRADLIFRAIEVPAGKHDVCFTYEPLSFKVGLGISLFTFALILIPFIPFSFLRRRDKY